jgi:hypothetical protein
MSVLSEIALPTSTASKLAACALTTLNIAAKRRGRLSPLYHELGALTDDELQEWHTDDPATPVGGDR